MARRRGHRAGRSVPIHGHRSDHQMLVGAAPAAPLNQLRSPAASDGGRHLVIPALILDVMHLRSSAAPEDGRQDGQLDRASSHRIDVAMLGRRRSRQCSVSPRPSCSASLRSSTAGGARQPRNFDQVCDQHVVVAILGRCTAAASYGVLPTWAGAMLRSSADTTGSPEPKHTSSTRMGCRDCDPRPRRQRPPLANTNAGDKRHVFMGSSPAV